MFIHPNEHQPTTSDDDSPSLLVAKESSILKLNRLVYEIILHGD